MTRPFGLKRSAARSFSCCGIVTSGTALGTSTANPTTPLIAAAGRIHLRRDTSGAAQTKRLAAASSIIQRPIASYETGNHEFDEPCQSGDATGGSSLPLELTPARTSVQRNEENSPLPSASTTACCSAAPRPILPGIHEKKLMIFVLGCPGGAATIVFIRRIRSTPAASIAALTTGIFADISADGSELVAVVPIADMTASAPEKASVKAL